MARFADHNPSRRDFLRLGGAAVAAGPPGPGNGRARAAGQAPVHFHAAPPLDTVRIGMVGIGLQGGSHVENFLRIPGCRITAVCDIRPERTDWATRAITAAGHPAPAAYTRGPRDFERLCAVEELDLVFTATPWEWHVPVMLAAMANGKHAATEVPAAMTLDDCWAIVEAAEKHRRHCVMMENCNYDRPELMVFNIVRQGLLGDVNTSLIRTALGKTVMVQHCTNLPRPYSRIHLVQGTKGLFQGYPHRLYIEGRGKPHQWVEMPAVREEFDHPLWKAMEARAAGAGHGGMDYIEDYRLIACLREGRPTDMTVYDAAALSAVIELSVQSNARRARAVDFPDFTRGRWRTNPRLDIPGA